jgi:excisionase family DNA binding protein
VLANVHDEYWTIGEVAEKLKVSTRTVYRWVDSGDLPIIKLTPGEKGNVRVSERDLEEFVEARRSRRGPGA